MNVFTLVFLVCMSGQGCQQSSAPNVFTSVEQCEAAAEIVYRQVEAQVASGQVPRHASTHRCINWGVGT